MKRSPQDPGITPALSGVKVVELSEFDAGASCAEALAWLGADVIKIEEPTSGEGRRFATTETPGVDSYDFIVLNANKRSVTCSNENLTKLLLKADVLVENLSPGTIERLGLGYEVIRKLNPRIIYAQIKGFASDGPRANYSSADRVAQSVGGAVSLTGFEGGPPLIAGPTIGDTGAALNGVIGILAALHQRHLAGHGQRVEVAMQDAVINLHRVAYDAQLSKGKASARVGKAARTSSVPSNLYPCKPGGPNDYVFISISKSATKLWLGLLKGMQREDLANDPRFSTPKTRVEHRDEIETIVSAWCREHTKIEAMEAIQPGAPAGAVLDTQELSHNPDLRKRGMLVTIEHPVRGAVTMPGWPIKMSESHVPVVSAPLLGAHTEEVISEWLGPSKKGGSEPRKEAPVGMGHGAQSDMNRALAGVRVVDLTQFEAGTSCTEALAWLGADVVKIEEPGRGERGRYVATDTPDVDAHYFIILNANKRSFTCDLKSERGKQILRKLIVNADVMVENMAPGVIERLGFGYDVVRALNPRIIFAQIKGFAPDGPCANYLCFDKIAQSAGGSLSTTGVKGGPPLTPAPNLGDTGTGMHCAAGILAALCQRQVTGRGQRIEVAMQEVVINFSRMAFAKYLASGKPPGREGDRGVYQCKGKGPNDYCVIDASSANNEQWHQLLRVVGRQDLIDHARFASRSERVSHSEEIDTLLSAWCSERSKIEVMDILQGAGVPAGAVLDTQELIDDPHLRKSGMFVTIEHPVRGPLTIPACPIRLSESHVPVVSAPLLGAHTEEVLSEWLALSKKEIQELRQETPVNQL